jgi:D-xylose 1-dehydrogenase (NADP+, D-xylono-1,5-lactone-forming)
VADALRWGVIGASSRIYQGRLKPPMEQGVRHRIVAEAGRDPDGSDAPYARLLQRPDVDAVYIPLPNDGHRRWILAALEAGKHVLCEKPLTMSPADTDEVYRAAASAGRALIEAYMWPHHPRSQAVLSVDVGPLRSMTGSFTFPLDRPGDHRLDGRGGGALFDVGIYCLGPMVLLHPGDPVRVVATAIRNEHGVDTSLSGWLDFGDGVSGAVTASFDAPHRRLFDLVGRDGEVHIADHFAPGPTDDGALQVRRRDGSFDAVPYTGVDAYAAMLDQFVDVIGGAAPRWGASESQRLARWIDALHHHSGPPQSNWG